MTTLPPPTQFVHLRWKLVPIVVALALLAFLLIYSNGFNEESTRRCIRLSAQISVLLFSLAFGASALQHLWPGRLTHWLSKHRKQLGVSFALTHLSHLFFLVMLQNFFHPVFTKAKTSSLIGGGLAYLFVLLMLLTSFHTFSKYLNQRQWKWLHLAGGYWIWFIFARSYWKNVIDKQQYYFFALLVTGLLILRWWHALQPRSEGRLNT